MPAPYTGGCLCGETRYVLNAEPNTLYACHCTDCQRRSGSAFALSLVASREALKLTSGRTILSVTKMPDGRVKQAQVCAACGTRLWGEPVKLPGIAIIQPGTLDDTSWLRPVAHIWTRSAQPWFRFPEGAVLFDVQPAPGELTKLWQARERAGA